MRKLFITLVLVTLCGLQAYNQSILRGKVINKSGEPLEYATVALYSLKDSVLQQGEVTGDDGHFIFNNIRQNSYYMAISMIGYTKVYTDPVLVTSNKTYTLPDVVLSEEVINMQGVTISATRNFVEQQADKMVINPEASITTASDNILEVLRKSPGIIVDKDDNIMLKNKQVKVMIDGRPTYLSGEQLATLLRNTQATSIERIEIIENPPARFDAEGTAGIINIRTKRGMMRGYNGSLTLGGSIAKYFSDNYGINMNYRNDKWNIYGNYFGGYRKGWNDVDLTRHFSQSDHSVFNQYSESGWRTFNNNVKLGIDYYITPKQVVGFMTQGSYIKDRFWGTSNGNIFDSNNEKIQQISTDNDGPGDFKSFTLNLNYKYTIDTLGQELNIDADMGKYYPKNINDMTTTYIPLIAPDITHKDQGSTDNFYSIKVDYVLPFNKKTKLETGVKSSYARMDGDLSFQQQDENGNWSDPNRMSNRFIYSENLNAAYLSAHHDFTEKTKAQIGLRGEQTRAKGDNRTSDDVNSRNYFNLFPSFFIQQKINDNHQLGFSYSYRIGRPPYSILNSFVWMLDPYTYNKGNPFLDAQFTHSTKLSYTLKNKYILSVDYSYTKNAWVQVFEQNDETRVTIIGWENLNNYYNSSVTLVLPIQITKWWNTNTNITGYYGQYQSPFMNGEINQSQFTFDGSTTFTFILPKDFAIELSGRYNSKSVYSMMKMQPWGTVDMGIQKQLFDKKATLKLNVNDIFKIQEFSYTSQYENVDLKGIQHYDSRRISLTFTWKFGSNDIKAARQRSTGLDDEAKRSGK